MAMILYFVLSSIIGHHFLISDDTLEGLGIIYIKPLENIQNISLAIQRRQQVVVVSVFLLKLAI